MAEKPFYVSPKDQFFSVSLDYFTPDSGRTEELRATNTCAGG
jgi:hypothetical protein